MQPASASLNSRRSAARFAPERQCLAQFDNDHHETLAEKGVDATHFKHVSRTFRMTKHPSLEAFRFHLRGQLSAASSSIVVSLHLRRFPLLCHRHPDPCHHHPCTPCYPNPLSQILHPKKTDLKEPLDSRHP